MYEPNLDPRYQMWCALLGDEYVSSSRNRKKQMKEQYCAMIGDDITPHLINEPISLACCPTAEPVPDASYWKTQYANVQTLRKEEKEKENTMGYNNATALVVQATPAMDPNEMSREYLKSRVNSEFWEKSALQDFYHMDEDYPETGQDTVDRILTGKYILHPKTAEDYDNSRIEWRDPAFPADKDGFKKAKDLLFAAKQKAMDEITVLFPEDGLAALREFEKFDPTTEVPYTVH